MVNERLTENNGQLALSEYMRKYINVICIDLKTEEEKEQAYKETWNKLYYIFKYIKGGCNLKLLAKNATKRNLDKGIKKGITALDIAIQRGYIDLLYSLACKLYPITSVWQNFHKYD